MYITPCSSQRVSCQSTGELSIRCCGKALNGLAQEYLCDMVESYAPNRVLRSASQNLLAVPRESNANIA